MAVVINGNGAVTGLTALPDSAMASGSVIQVVSTTLTAASTATMSTNGEVTLLSRTYTPTFSSSNALIQVSVHVDIANQYGGMFINVLRDSTIVARGDAASNRRQVTIVPDFTNTSFGGALKSFTLLDTGISGTSEVTYKVNMLDQNGNGGEYYLNTGRDNSDNDYILRSVSTLTVMEIKA
tara:strand:+ start:39 stop:581 length:543 start_codon:yes stop_codon:yes gene_type:complete